MVSSMILAALHGETAVYANMGRAEEDDDVADSTTASVLHTIMSSTTTKTTTMASALAMSSTTEVPDHDAAVSMNNFYPALVQCFGIIICGWVDSTYIFFITYKTLDFQGKWMLIKFESGTSIVYLPIYWFACGLFNVYMQYTAKLQISTDIEKF